MSSARPPWDEEQTVTVTAFKSDAPVMDFSPPGEETVITRASDSIEADVFGGDTVLFKRKRAPSHWPLIAGVVGILVLVLGLGIWVGRKTASRVSVPTESQPPAVPAPAPVAEAPKSPKPTTKSAAASGARRVASAPKASKSPNAVPAPVKPATLTLESTPWAIVYLDGKRLARRTPVNSVRVSPGPHTVIFYSPVSNKEVTRKIDVKAGARLSLHPDLR